MVNWMQSLISTNVRRCKNYCLRANIILKFLGKLVLLYSIGYSSASEFEKQIRYAVVFQSGIFALQHVTLEGAK